MADEATSPAVAGRRSKPKRHYHHGRSPAAWAGVTLAGIGFLIAAIASVMGPNWTMIWIAGGLILLSLIVGGAMKAAGYGNN